MDSNFVCCQTEKRINKAIGLNWREKQKQKQQKKTIGLNEYAD